MYTYRSYKMRAELALDLARVEENAGLRDKYLKLAKDWSEKADAARDAPSGH